MGNEEHKKEHKYEFKYVYLIILIALVLLIIVSFALPKFFPDFFIEEQWIMSASSEAQTISLIEENIPTKILEIVKDILISALVGIILFIIYEHRFDKKDKEEMINDINEHIETKVASSVLEMILSNETIVVNNISEKCIDQVLINCLKSKLQDDSNGKALAISKSLIENFINKRETVTDLNVTITIKNTSDEHKIYSKYDSYIMNYRINYKMQLKEHNDFEFILTNDKSFQLDNLGTLTYCQFVDSSFSGNNIFFKVNEIAIDGSELKYKDEQIEKDKFIKKIYSGINAELGSEIPVEYSVDFLVRKNGNHYSYFTPFMTKNIRLTFNAEQSDIQRIKILPYLNSDKDPVIEYDNPINPKIINISLNDWTLPNSGISFIWQFEKK